ncbi:NAD-dependent epimerase/dehydratase family protein [Pelagibacteraceae bacterium]|nr:NAD-dependent epimerase/dehydratase family protein [Pelagibacteraceae bacterium]
MNILITGSKGLIGSELVKILKEEKISFQRVTRPQKKNFFEFNNKLILKKKINTLIHLAWGKLDDYNSIDHIKTFPQIHFEFINNLIKLGIRRVFVAGTCFEYGNKIGKVDESSEINPNSNYAVGKNKLYKKIKALQKKKRFDFIWGRIFYVYGKSKFKKNIYNQIVLNKKKKIYVSNPNTKIDYISAKDVAKKIYVIIKSKKSNDIVNICSGKPKFLKTYIKNWNKKSKNLIIYINNNSKNQCKGFWGSNLKYKEMIK